MNHKRGVTIINNNYNIRYKESLSLLRRAGVEGYWVDSHCRVILRAFALKFFDLRKQYMGNVWKTARKRNSPSAKGVVWLT